MKRTALAIALSIAASSAFGAAITGSIGFGDGLANAETLPNEVVTGLTTFVPVTTVVAPCVGDFAGCSGTGTAANFSFSSGTQLIFTEGSLQFFSTQVPTLIPPGSITPLSCVPVAPGSTIDLCTDKLTFNGRGFIHDTSANFDDTLALISWAVTGNCLDTNGDSLCDSQWAATYSAVVTGTGIGLQVPEPTPLALAGLGLVALGWSRRKM